MASSTTSPLRRPRVILFDVNETLLDMGPLKLAVNAAFGNKAAFNQWFGLLLQHSLVATVTDSYFAFATIADAALDMTAHMLQERPLTHAEKQALTARFAQLPSHPDVPEGLRQLRAAGYRLAAFTNSTAAALAEQLRYAGLTEYFDQQLSVDAVRRYKPHPDTYRYAIEEAGVGPRRGPARGRPRLGCGRGPGRGSRRRVPRPPRPDAVPAGPATHLPSPHPYRTGRAIGVTAGAPGLARHE